MFKIKYLISILYYGILIKNTIGGFWQYEETVT